VNTGRQRRTLPERWGRAWDEAARFASLRPGSWYRVLSLGPAAAVIEVDGQAITVAREALYVTSTAPRSATPAGFLARGFTAREDM
jgi:hypothetical protein